MPRRSTPDRPAIAKSEMIAVSELKPHPRNYRTHPDDQIEHLMQSIREHGLYRNVVTARDGTILAGHGIVIAATLLGYSEVAIVRLDLNPTEPRALKVLAGDNEIGHLIDVDDRALSELLKEVLDFDIDGLLGTGYDEMMLANLLMVTRPASEIQNIDEAAHWVGMPSYEREDDPLILTVRFKTQADKADFADRLGIILTEQSKSTWWPVREYDDVASVRLVSDG